MKIEVIDCVIRNNKRNIAKLLIQYYEIILKCELVYYPKYDKVWVRMPEVWLTPDKKVQYCYWPTKEKSDEFQKELLKKIFDKYDLSLEKIRAQYIESCAAKKKQKIYRQN